MRPSLARSCALLLVLLAGPRVAAQAPREPDAGPAPSIPPAPVSPSPPTPPSTSSPPTTPPVPSSVPPAPTAHGPTAPAPAPAETVPAQPAPTELSPTTPMFSPAPSRGGASSSVSLATGPAPAPYTLAPTTPTYVLPFQLRSVAPRTGIRIDTLAAPYRRDDMSALATVVFLSGQVRLSQHFSLQGRWGFDDNRVGNGDHNHTGVVNPALGAMLAFPIGHFFRFAASSSISLPVATGGGADANPDAVLLQRQAALARSAMDNAAFAVNDLGFPTGLSFAFLYRSFTAQVDGTVIPSGRVKGTGSSTDNAKVNSTLGLFLGYLVIPEISVGAELRYQYYLLPPAIVDQDPSARDNLTAGAGARVEIELSDSTRMRPGFCISTGLAGYVEQQSFRMVQFDVPISF